MNIRTKEYLRKRFQDYYQTLDLILPPDFTKREWGFILFDEMPDIVMRRHKAFLSGNEALEYIQGMVPAHLYHSAAYYRFPGARTMKEKQWEGADLIFDLDADHLPLKARSYAEMLSNVKEETKKLLDFLLSDFGFSKDNVSIVFSGGRGYHIHVRDPYVFSLESKERREIVDYVSGTGLNPEFFFETEKFISGEGKFQKIEHSKRISSFDGESGLFGWGKRISQYLVYFLEDISKKDDEEALNEITEMIRKYNVRKSSTVKIPADIVRRTMQIKKENPKIRSDQLAKEAGVSKEKLRDILITNNMWDFKREAVSKLKILKEYTQNPKTLEMVKDGFIDFPRITYIFDAIVENAVEENSVYLGAGHTDEPVTADIKRLIRMPMSLHGGSGMQVVPLSLSEFEKFAPLDDAVVFSKKEIDVEVIPPLKPQNSIVEMKGKRFTVTEGINTLPEYAAIYLMCRGAAEYA